MTRTYIDSDVLIYAAHKDHPLYGRCLAVLGDPQREFVSSIFLRMETADKAEYNGRTEELRFMERFFAAEVQWAEVTHDLVRIAHEDCRVSGLNALDALHVAAAASLGADELVTTERPAKSIHRTRLVKVVTFRAAEE